MAKKNLIEVVGPMGRKVLPVEIWEKKYKTRDNWCTVKEYEKKHAPKKKKKKTGSKK